MRNDNYVNLKNKADQIVFAFPSSRMSIFKNPSFKANYPGNQGIKFETFKNIRNINQESTEKDLPYFGQCQDFIDQHKRLHHESALKLRSEDSAWKLINFKKNTEIVINNSPFRRLDM